jgi:hypothetical protein
MDNAAMLSGSIKRMMRWMELVLLRSWQRNEIVAHTSVAHTSVAHTSKVPDQDTIINPGNTNIRLPDNAWTR